MIPSLQVTNKVPRPRRRDNVLERVLANELILYQVEKDQIFLLNQISAAVWDLCDGSLSEAEIAQTIFESIRTEQDMVLSDVQDTVEQLHKEGLLIDGH